MNKEKFRKVASYYREGDNALIAIQDNDNGHIIINNTANVDDVLLEVLDKYIKQRYPNFNGNGHECIDFYRCKINRLLYDIEKEYAENG